ncbi:MAG: DUF2950 domain-containing protein [Actinomycetota bacterium]
MKLQLSKMNARTVLLALMAIVFACTTAVWAQSQVQKLLPPSKPAPQQQKSFATPQLAAQALISAAEKFDVPALLEIFGPEGKDLVASADAVRDRDLAQRFVDKAHEKNAVTVRKARAVLVIGKEDWPMPIPIVKKRGKWYFDTKAGKREILFRRIGSNELDAIRICRGFVEAQKEYASATHDDSGIHQYAQRIISSPGRQDGLFWNNPDGSAGGPISKPIAKAIQEGYSTTGGPSPYHGYVFKVLKGQGPAAPLGQMDFVVKGAMIGGFALVATPADYRVTGVKTFMVSHDGIVYEKDLGPNSLKLVKAMERYNPDKGWRVTNDEEQ